MTRNPRILISRSDFDSLHRLEFEGKSEAVALEHTQGTRPGPGCRRLRDAAV